MVVSGSAMAQATVDDAVKAIKTNKDVKAVEAIVKEATKAVKKDAVALAKIGRAYLDVKDTANTRKYANMAIQCEIKKKADKSAAGYLLMGDLEYFNDNPGDAAANYQNAIYFEPKNPQGYIKYARTNRGVSPDLAVKQLEEVRTMLPDYPVDAEAGHIYYEAAKKKSEYMPKVMSYYEKVGLQKLYDHDPSYLTEYALAAFASQKNDVSKKVAEYGLTKKPRNAGYNRLALYNSYDMKEYADAEKYVDALFNKSDSAEFTAMDYKYAGLTFSAQKKYDEAIKYYERQLADTKTDEAKAGIYKNISDAYKEKGDFDASIASYEKYLAVNPKATATDYSNLASIYVGQAEKATGAEQQTAVDKAVGVYKTMAEKFPKNATYGNYMAARVLALLDPDQTKGLAKPYYESILASIEANGGVKDARDKSYAVTSLSYIGIYLFKIKNDPAAAKPYFEKLQQIDPENALAQQVLATYAQ